MYVFRHGGGAYRRRRHGSSAGRRASPLSRRRRTAGWNTNRDWTPRSVSGLCSHTWRCRRLRTWCHATESRPRTTQPIGPAGQPNAHQQDKLIVSHRRPPVQIALRHHETDGCMVWQRSSVSARELLATGHRCPLSHSCAPGELAAFVLNRCENRCSLEGKQATSPDPSAAEGGGMYQRSRLVFLQIPVIGSIARGDQRLNCSMRSSINGTNYGIIKRQVTTRTCSFT